MEIDLHGLKNLKNHLPFAGINQAGPPLKRPAQQVQRVGKLHGAFPLSLRLEAPPGIKLSLNYISPYTPQSYFVSWSIHSKNSWLPPSSFQVTIQGTS